MDKKLHRIEDHRWMITQTKSQLVGSVRLEQGVTYEYIQVEIDLMYLYQRIAGKKMRHCESAPNVYFWLELPSSPGHGLSVYVDYKLIMNLFIKSFILNCPVLTNICHAKYR